MCLERVTGTVDKVAYLEVIVQCYDIPVPLRYTLQHRDFIANLWMGLGFSIGVHRVDCSCSKTYHVLPTLHEFLVNDLASKVLAGLDVYRFFDDSIRPTSKGFTSPILQGYSISAPVNDRR